MNLKSIGRKRPPGPHQREVQWPEPESFALITQQAVDGDRVTKEAAQSTADQQAGHKLQPLLLP